MCVLMTFNNNNNNKKVNISLMERLNKKTFSTKEVLVVDPG